MGDELGAKKRRAAAVPKPAATPAIMAKPPEALQGASPLEDFLASAGTMTADEKLILVNQAILLLEGFYVHLPLKRAMHAVEPLQRLRLLRHRLGQLVGETHFHSEMTSIFTSVRDLHTNYLLPSPYREVLAFVPFRVEDYFEGNERRYIVTAIVGTMPHASFEVGVHITYWNGVPIARAVATAADKHAGSNQAARHSRGLAGLTQRPLRIVAPPDEEWVTVSYVGLDGTARETRFSWQVQGLPQAGLSIDPNAMTLKATALGYDLETVAIQAARQKLFAPQVTEACNRIAVAAASGSGIPAELIQGTDSIMPNVLTAHPVNTTHGTFGYIRIRTFSVDSDTAFVNEFMRLAELMPQNGLIIDVRDNGGGLIWAGERLLQILTPKMIEPERLQFINTSLTDKLAKSSSIDLSQWAPSIARAVETGAPFSCSFPITDPASCNDIGQRYHGPVVLITNARCYSTTDIFAAGFQDHKIGPVLGVDNNTGAGGANVWEHGLLLRHVGQPLQALPGNAGMRVAIRRTLRVGDQAGTELEDLGVSPDYEHRMTKRDLLENNIDLIARAASLFTSRPVFRLQATATRVNNNNLRLVLTTSNLDRIDIELNGRPQQSVDIVGNVTTIDVPTTLTLGVVALKGFRNGNLAAARRLTF